MLFGSYIRDYEQLGADRVLCCQLFDAYQSIRNSVISKLGADTRTSVLRLCFHHLVELLALEDRSNALSTRSSTFAAIGRYGQRLKGRVKNWASATLYLQFFELKASDVVSESDLETVSWSTCMIFSKSIHIPLYPTTGGGICNS